jgi:hypothetical protein
VTDGELKLQLLQLIGNSIDETSISTGNSFVEMDQQVIHYAGDAGDRYFKVILQEVGADQYFVAIDMDKL